MIEHYSEHVMLIIHLSAMYIINKQCKKKHNMYAAFLLSLFAALPLNFIWSLANEWKNREKTFSSFKNYDNYLHNIKIEANKYIPICSASNVPSFSIYKQTVKPIHKP